jgi:valyl-tRNA synthetase
MLPYLKSLAKLSDIKIDPTGAIIDELGKNAPVVILEGTRLLLEVELDLEFEKSRLEKELARLTKEIEKSGHKLQNEEFIKRAPAEVVVQEQARLKDFKALHEQLLTQYKRLA